ncbi:hypothetical protein Tco_0619398 [Tanacetum coccineum]
MGCILLIPPLVVVVEESSASGAARQDRPTIARDDLYSIVREDLYGFVDVVDVPPRCSTSKELDYDITDTWDDLVGAIDEIAPTTIEGVNQRVTDLATIVEGVYYQNVMLMRLGDYLDASDSHVQLFMSLRTYGSGEESLVVHLISRVTISRSQETEGTDGRSLEAAWTAKGSITRGADAPGEDGSSSLRFGLPSIGLLFRNHLVSDIMKHGIEGVVGLTQWFEKMESVYSISNCTVACQAHAMPWRTLKKMMTNKYCPQGEIKKLEFEMWNLKVKGNDVVAYSHRLQELGTNVAI